MERLQMEMEMGTYPLILQEGSGLSNSSQHGGQKGNVQWET